jgi:Holliday junction resolvase RusA-like endonuclease
MGKADLSSSKSAQIVEIDLPAPLSVNAMRRIDWTSKKTLARWIAIADHLILQAKRRAENPLKLQAYQRFALEVTFSEENSKLDLDNGLKLVIDYLHRIELIEDDSPRHLRRITVQWGPAPMGTRVKIIPCP